MKRTEHRLSPLAAIAIAAVLAAPPLYADDNASGTSSKIGRECASIVSVLGLTPEQDATVGAVLHEQEQQQAGARQAAYHSA